jgi:hypothetical protein
MSPAGNLTTLTTFDYFKNGAYPAEGVTEGPDHNFYGVTEQGGTNADLVYGTVFKVTPEGELTTLFCCSENSARYPNSGLLLATDGKLYGSMKEGGTNGSGNGIIFAVTTNGTLETLTQFSGLRNSPAAKLLEVSDGKFYAMTSSGEILAIKKIGDVTTSGSIDLPLIYPAPPVFELLEKDGVLYGTTHSGSNFGSVFKLSDNVITTLVKFGDKAFDGVYPSGGLVEGRDGNLYGTTSSGGEFGLGTVFRIIMPVNLRSQVSGNDLLLSWPTNQVGFTLQSASDLNASNWIVVAGAPAIVDGKFTVTNSLSQNAQFFRLHK